MDESETMIRVDGLGKKYLIRHKQHIRNKYSSLREDLVGAVASLGRRLVGQGQAADSTTREEFWAIQDVSFEIKRGDVTGLIGRNGAGKSTLLKVLSRITEPTSGRVELNGRVASLLEIGTGFHPELTGRENIFMNGAILGMARAEIKRKFDEIVSFAGVEKFLDTPVKRYSSGMYVRLAFAVAAHLESEILVIDEVLAVGDAEFQRKCIGKMEESAKSGRTVIFVSHNLASVRAFCNRALGLHNGQLVRAGETEEVLKWYLGSVSQNSNDALEFDDPKDGRPAFRSIKLLNPVVSYGDTMSVELVLSSKEPAVAAVEVELHDQRGAPLIHLSTALMNGSSLATGPEGKRHVLNIGPLPLASGEYFLYFWLIRSFAEKYHVVPTPLRLVVEQSDPGSTGSNFNQALGRGGVTVPVRCDTFQEFVF